MMNRLLRFLLTEYVLFNSFTLITLLHNAVRKFVIFSAPPGGSRFTKTALRTFVSYPLSVFPA